MIEFANEDTHGTDIEHVFINNDCLIVEGDIRKKLHQVSHIFRL